MKARDMKSEFHEFTQARLVLALLDREWTKDFSFSPGRDWLRIQHQTSGHACGQVRMWCTFLTPRTDTLAAINDIERSWYDTDLGAWSVQLDDVLKYRKMLNDKLGVDCNWAYEDLAEAIYPIDCTVDNLRKLCVDEIPDNLESLIQFDNDMSSIFGIVNRWKLYIIGENCD